LGNALVPEVWTHGQGAEEAETPPVCGEVGTDQGVIEVGAERRRWGGAPPRMHQVGVAHERHGIGKPEERAEGEAEDALSLGQIVLVERTNRDVHALCSFSQN
jgi:hypothetical protein